MFIINKMLYKFNKISLFILFCYASPVLAGWEVTWIDKFDETTVDWTSWTAQTQANYNNEVQCYTDDDSSADKNYDVSNGTLKIIARRQSVNCPGLGGQQKSWTSGRLNSKDKREFKYGRIESRIRFNELKGGTWPAFWMLEGRIFEQPIANDGDNINWPNPGAGEIDIWEWFSNNPASYITNFFNAGSCGHEVRYSYPGGSVDVQQWHKYAMEWDANRIAFYMDDKLVTEHAVMNCSQYKEPMFVLLNVAMGGNLGGDIDPSLNIATMEVDYVAYCKSTNSNQELYCDENTPVSTGNTVPEITSISITEATTEQLYSYTLTATDNDIDILVYGVTLLPTWLDFDVNTAILSGTPDISDIGSHPVTLTVSNDNSNVSQSFTIIVLAPPNNAPIISSVNPVTSVIEGTLYNYTLTATDPEDDDLTFSATTKPDWLTFNSTSGILTGTPAITDVGSQAVELIVSDEVNETFQNFTVTVTSKVSATNSTPMSGGGSSSNILLVLVLLFIQRKVYKN
jgi:beta-glucanase (GH16 family)